MGQQEMYELLKQNPGQWFRSKELAELGNTSEGSATRALKKVSQSYKEISCRRVKKGRGNNPYQLVKEFRYDE